MVNVKLGDQTYEGVQTVQLDTPDGGTVDFAPYDETFAAGKAEGYEEGKDDGIQSEYDRFWDTFQNQSLSYGQSGNPMNSNFLFAGFGWKDVNFRPKYVLRPTMAMQMFYFSQITDLAAILEECGSGLDTTACTGFNGMFQYSAVTRVPAIAVLKPSSASSISGMFNGCTNLREIEKIILGDGVVVNFDNVFNDTTSLTTVSFEGTIARAINFQWSPLSVASMKSVITHLKNYAGTADAATYKVTFTDACWTALEADSTAPDGNTWRDYVETTLGWLT